MSRRIMWVLLFIFIYVLNLSGQTELTNKALLIQTINEIKNAVKIKDIVLYNLQISSNYLEYLKNNKEEPATVTNKIAKEVLMKPLKEGSFNNVKYKSIDVEFSIKKETQIGNNYKLEVEFNLIVLNENDVEENEQFILKFELQQSPNRLWEIVKIE